MTRIVVTGLGFGDEGKGSIVDFLCRSRPVDLVIRYNGGAQAAHNVVEPNGRHHTFAQFGSGTLAGVSTYLSEYVKVNPLFLESEAAHLVGIGVEKPQDLLRINVDAVVTHPYHVASNRFRELLRARKHGTCGMGVGETVSDAISFPEETLLVHHLKDPDAIAKRLRTSQLRKQAEFKKARIHTEALAREHHVLHDAALFDEIVERYLAFSKAYEFVPSSYLEGLLTSDAGLVFEGAQGVLLDENYGFHPHTTWSHTTGKNARTLLNRHSATYLGVLRAYHTRHGAGPFPTENEELGYAKADHNKHGPWQKGFRVGHFDTVLARYAQDLAQCDELAITCLDHLEINTVVAHTYAIPSLVSVKMRAPYQPNTLEDQIRNTELLQKAQPAYIKIHDFVRYVENELDVPVTIRSYGPTHQDKQCR